MLPMDILNRPKKGFSIPMDLWLWEHGTFRDMVYDTLLDRRTQMRGQFNPSSVRSMLEDHDKLRQFHGYRLWTLFVFEMWQRNFADSWCTKET
jgi:asparagine synthase (glutamine-hydrolysing)